MSPITKEQIINILKTIIDPDTGQDIVSSGIVSSIIIRNHTVGFALEFPADQVKNKENLSKRCEQIVASLPGVEKVTVVLTSHNESPTAAREAKSEMKQEHRAARMLTPPAPVAGVKQIIAVASGKGGVGKSTVSVNLAIALAQQGYKVGMVDADIYGPSLPHMLGNAEKPAIDKSNRMIPLERHGIKSISMGYLIAEGAATVWRGSMATKALFQLIRGTNWTYDDVPLDYLIIDMPPGTGDIHLSLAENYPVNGAVIVSTPQDIALLDAKKAINMFDKVSIPVLGIIENMSYFEDPVSKNRTYIFGEGGAKKMAQDYGISFLGDIPINPELREGGDNGTPAALLDTEVRVTFQRIATQLAASLSSYSAQKQHSTGE